MGSVHLSLFGVVATCALLACGAPDARYPQERRLELLAEYPPGTKLADVRAHEGHEPDVAAVRAEAGWTGPSRVAANAVASERRTGKPVGRVERYSGADPGGSSFLSLCHRWFFYDETDRVVDVAWEYMSD